MELRDYWKIIKRRWAILVIVPIVAAVGTTGYLVSQPRQYDATATVAAPALVGGSSSNQYSGSDGPKAFVANFVAAIASPKIVDQVAEQTGVKKGALQSGITAAQVGTSSIVTVTATLSKKDKVDAVARDAASDTLVFLFANQVRLAQAPLTRAQQAVAADRNAITAYTSKIGDPVPDQTYTVLSTEVSQLQQTEIQDYATGLKSAADYVASQLVPLKAQLATLGPEVATYDQLQAQLTQAQSSLNQLQTAYNGANAQFQEANPNAAVTLNGDVHKVSLTSTVPIKAGSALIGGLVLAVAIVIFVELLARRREQQAAPAVAPAEGGQNIVLRPDGGFHPGGPAAPAQA